MKSPENRGSSNSTSTCSPFHVENSGEESDGDILSGGKALDRAVQEEEEISDEEE